MGKSAVLVHLHDSGWSLYHITNCKNKIVYVGITQDFKTRTTQHINSSRLGKGYNIDEIERNLTHEKVRGSEQAHIEHYNPLDTSQRGIYDENGKFPVGAGNRARSYDPSRLENPDDHRAKDFNDNYKDRMKSHSGKICKK